MLTAVALSVASLSRVHCRLDEYFTIIPCAFSTSAPVFFVSTEKCSNLTNKKIMVKGQFQWSVTKISSFSLIPTKIQTSFIFRKLSQFCHKSPTSSNKSQLRNEKFHEPKFMNLKFSVLPQLNNETSENTSWSIESTQQKFTPQLSRPTFQWSYFHSLFHCVTMPFMRFTV